MKKRTTNILMMMFLSMMASLIATAQTTQKKLPAEASTLSTQQLQAGNGAGFSMEKASADSLGKSADATTQAFSIEWNYIHPENWEMYYSDGYPYVVIYAQGGGYFYTTDPVVQAVINPACQTENWLAFYVYNSSNNWSNVYTYTYK